MKNLCLSLPILAVFVPMAASATTVYSGCSIPALKSGHRTFYVDPANGTMSGDGSASKPWHTLAEVLDPANKLVSTQSHAYPGYRNGTDTALHAVNPNAPIKAGDLILLKSGQHGSPKLSNMFNADFITIAAAPGATPVVGTTDIASSAKWLFQGLTFEGAAKTTTGATSVPAAPTGVLNALNLVTVGLEDWIGASSDIAFDNDTFRTAASTSGWTDADWYVKPMNNMIKMHASCTSLVSSHLLNLANGVAIAASQSLVQGNIIEYFSNDAIDIASSYVLVKNNTIRNGVNKAVDPLHPDGIQGVPQTVNGTVVKSTNVVVDGNTMVKTGNASTTYMQGISFFTGKWDGLVIQNNVVAVNVWDALSVYGAQNSKVLNNTVIASDPVGHPSWIQVHNAGDGTVSSNVLVRNNIATQFDLAGGAVYDHNIAATMITTYPGNTKTVTTSGTIGTANAVLPAVLNGFMSLNTSTGVFDLRLRPTSVAVGFGTGASAPALDILGKSRTPPVDVGAYVH